MYGELKVSLEVYEQRRDRLKNLIDSGAETRIVGCCARLLAECFHYTFWQRVEWWWINRGPFWLLWLTFSDYRKFARGEFPASRYDSEWPACPKCGSNLGDDDVTDGEEPGSRPCAACRGPHG